MHSTPVQVFAWFIKSFFLGAWLDHIVKGQAPIYTDLDLLFFNYGIKKKQKQKNLTFGLL